MLHPPEVAAARRELVGRVEPRAVAAIARTEVTKRIRNRSAIVTAFLGPLILALVFGLLLGGTDDFSTTVGVVDLDDSEVSAPFVDALVGSSTDEERTVEFRVVGSRDEAVDAVDTGDLGAAIVVPAGLGATVLAGGTPEVEVLRDPSRTLTGAIAHGVANRYLTTLRTEAITAGAVGVLGGDTSDLGAATPPADVLVDGELPGNEISPLAFFGASMSILLLFFTVSFAARSIIVERASGVLGRILAAGVSARSVVMGKVVAVGALGLTGLLVVWLVTSLVFGATWGDPVGVVVVAVCTVVAVAGVATFVCGFARTEQQADTYTSALAFVLALLGGNFVGPGEAPAALRSLARLTPNGQALDAFGRISIDGASLLDVAPNVAALLAFGIGFGVVGLARIERTVRS
jgi:ABC-2 type transport system permease protein